MKKKKDLFWLGDYESFHEEDVLNVNFESSEKFQ